MASSPGTPLVSAYDLTTVWTEAYTVPSNISRTIFDAATFNNYSVAGVTFSVRLIQPDGASDSLTEIITELNISSKKNNLGAALIGQSLSTGGILELKASVNTSINANITGTEIEG